MKLKKKGKERRTVFRKVVYPRRNANELTLASGAAMVFSLPHGTL